MEDRLEVVAAAAVLLHRLVEGEEEVEVEVAWYFVSIVRSSGSINSLESVEGRRKRGRWREYRRIRVAVLDDGRAAFESRLSVDGAGHSA